MQLGVWVMTWACEPSEPQAVGPIPAVSDGPTTTAPAPSAKMNAVPRSVGSMKRLSCSTPMTSTWLSAPARTIDAARLSAWQKPAHPAEMSNAAAVMPSAEATWGAEAGVCSGWVDVATMTQPTCSAPTPAACSAFSAAEIDMPMRVSSSAAKRRVLMPDRVWIHSSEESRTSQTSSLVTTRAGRWTPSPSIAAWVRSVDCWMVMGRA